jgi:putative membrane protein
MRQLKHPHKFIILSEIIKSLKNSIVPLFLFLISVGTKIPPKYGGHYTAIAVSIVLLVIIIVLAILKWRKNVYDIQAEGMYIKYGVFKIHERTVPFAQVQTADISSSIVQRLFNVYKLEIDTAGGDKKSEVSILLSKQEALRVKTIIFEGHKNKDQVEIMEYKNLEKFTCTLKDLFVMATTSSRNLVGFFIIIAFYYKIEDKVPQDFKLRVGEYGNNAIKNVNSASMIKFIVALIIIIFFISWVISVSITVIKYYNFTVIREEGNIKLSYGYFDKKEVTIPVKRIQSLIIVEGIIRKPLGYFSLNVETIGYGKDKGESTMICPIAKKKVLDKFFQDILPEMKITYDLVNSPRKALKGFLLLKLTYDFIVMAIIAKFAPYGYYIFLLVPIIVIWHYIRFRDNGLYSSNGFIVMRYRKFAKHTVIIQKECIQSIEKTQNIFQKKKAIASYKVTIAGDNLGESFKVSYMSENYIDNIV